MALVGLTFARLNRALRAMTPHLATAITGSALLACTAPPASTVASKPTASAAPAANPSASHTTPGYSWPNSTFSPNWAEPSAELRDLAKRCARFERGLVQVAQQIADRQAQHLATPTPEEVRLALRAAGEPHVWERIWSLNGTQLHDQDAAARIDAWLSKSESQGELRCGIARAQSQDLQALAVIAIDVVADLQPIPTRARLGQWITVDAQLGLPTRDARVVVMGPTGLPRAVLTSPPRDDHIRAQVALDQPGPWLVQVMTVLDTGPRPALEAMVFVDSEPLTHFEQHPAPGETAGQGGPSAARSVLRMTNGARASAGLNALLPDPALDQLAQEHAQAMLSARRLAHDLGSGGPADRVARAGLVALAVGENLATASTLVNAHRALWASPSHRSAMLEARFTSAGIGVAVAEDRSIWLCELFANFGATGKISPVR